MPPFPQPSIFTHAAKVSAFASGTCISSPQDRSPSKRCTSAAQTVVANAAHAARIVAVLMSFGSFLAKSEKIISQLRAA